MDIRGWFQVVSATKNLNSPTQLQYLFAVNHIIGTRIILLQRLHRKSDYKKRPTSASNEWSNRAPSPPSEHSRPSAYSNNKQNQDETFNYYHDDYEAGWHAVYRLRGMLVLLYSYSLYGNVS